MAVRASDLSLLASCFPNIKYSGDQSGELTVLSGRPSVGAGGGSCGQGLRLPCRF